MHCQDEAGTFGRFDKSGGQRPADAAVAAGRQHIEPPETERLVTARFAGDAADRYCSPIKASHEQFLTRTVEAQRSRLPLRYEPAHRMLAFDRGSELQFGKIGQNRADA